MFFYNGPSAAHEKIPGIGNWPFRDNLIWGEFYTKNRFVPYSFNKKKTKEKSKNVNAFEQKEENIQIK